MSDPTERPRRTPRDEELPSLLESVEASGGNIAAFAREHGLSPWKLYGARRLAEGGRVRRKRRRRVEVRDFLPVRIVEERAMVSAPLELVVGSGHRVLIRAGFDAVTLLRLVEVLGSC